MLGKSTTLPWLPLVGARVPGLAAAAVALLGLGAQACTDAPGDGLTDETDTETDTVPTGDDDDDDDDTTEPLRQDEGSVVVAAWLPYRGAEEPSTVMAGLFVEDDLGWANLAQCAAMPQAFCTSTIPQNPGESVIVSQYDPSVLDQVTTRQVGDPLELGSLAADLQVVEDQSYYYAAWTTADLPTGDLGLHLSGEWGPYDGTADVTSPEPMVVTSPDPMANNEFFDAEPIHLAWTPGDGDVFLYVSSLLERRLYRLEDTGSYDLDLLSLGLPDRTDIDLVLGRWGVGTVDHDGHEVSVLVQSNQQIKGVWRVVGSRQELLPYDECAYAETAPGVGPGAYFADLNTGFRNDLNPGADSCIQYAQPGNEGVFPVDLAPDERLTVTYTLTQADAGLYIVTDCNRANTCVGGNDVGVVADPETVQYVNETGYPERVYVVLDSFRDGQIRSIANVEVAIDSLSGDILEPTCMEAMDQGPAQPGVYFGYIGGNANLLDPECVGDASGGEGLTQIYLLPNQTLTATVTTADANPMLYVMYNCSIADSCIDGANQNPTPDSETLVYQNLSGFSEFVYLAVDGGGRVDEYVLDIEVQ